MVDRFHDFDAAWEEATGASPPPKIRVYDETIELPVEPPAEFMLKLISLRERALGEDRDQAATLTEALNLLKPFYGEERVAAWIGRGIGLTRATMLVDHTLDVYRPPPAEDPDEGEASAPTTTDSNETSSKDGGSSKPTGTASTEPS
jgi:hypothetical protein